MAARAFVWLGGALFVVALAWCAWWYLFEAGRDRPFGGGGAIAVDTALFTIFALHHSVFARDAAKRWLDRIPPNLVRSVYVYAASLLLIFVCVAWRPIGGEIYRAEGMLEPALIALQLIGLAVIARSVARIDPLELAGIHPPRSTDGLQTSGPYRWVRHPLYFGWLLAVFGTPHLTGDRLTFAVISVAYLVTAVLWEERSLLRVFGDDYGRYQREVRWRIIPFIY
ncbi:MAG TPA: isoprenylcysteine carboxylmethyltransferase family protein [Vicinamibacterales bacterium]|nr:isoprenylcysteine carboxylmethyltransferase family protein [Vicinamibacterales bacterium]